MTKRVVLLFFSGLISAVLFLSSCGQPSATTSSPSTPQNNTFDLEVNSVFPLTSQGTISNEINTFQTSDRYDFVIFEITIAPPSDVKPNLRYFIELHSTDGHFFDNSSVVWTDQELIKPNQLDAGERDVRKIEAYKAAMSDWPPSKNISLRVPFFDVAEASFETEYNFKNLETIDKNQSKSLLYSKYGIHVSSEDLNIIFHKYFRLSIHS